MFTGRFFRKKMVHTGNSDIVIKPWQAPGRRSYVWKRTEFSGYRVQSLELHGWHRINFMLWTSQIRMRLLSLFNQKTARQHLSLWYTRTGPNHSGHLRRCSSTMLHWPASLCGFQVMKSTWKTVHQNFVCIFWQGGEVWCFWTRRKVENIWKQCGKLCVPCKTFLENSRRPGNNVLTAPSKKRYMQSNAKAGCLMTFRSHGTGTRNKFKWPG